ncbi:hypothetical protein OAU89_01885 [bacterium]|jgi:hypothetical protein|nr:hypothetical protein [bacterium]MDG1434066.1 hypothetical protein [Saprospiraceae bacterium]
MKLFQLLLFISLLTSCEEEQKCKYNINPIFTSTTSNITNHSFDHKGTKATEKATFPNGVRLELFQTICNDSQQEYHFFISGDFKDKTDEFWVNQAAEQFFNMARSAKEVEGVSAFGVLIQNDPKVFPLGEQVGIQDGIFVKIDKLVGIEESQVIVKISQAAK